MAKRIPLESFPSELKKIIKEYTEEVIEVANAEIKARAKITKEALSRESPVGATKKMSSSWTYRLNKKGRLHSARIYNRERGIVADYHDQGTSKMPSPNAHGFATKVAKEQTSEMYEEMKNRIKKL